ncbi:ribonuclease H-like domain-containing protein [Spinellus fusiger]|nr:ribonuclease H-like domain-containing protein [Spinellus fusiger]
MSAEIPDPALQFKEYQASLFKALVSATSASNSIPSKDLGFYRSLDREFAKDLDHVGSRLLTLSNALLQQCSNSTGINTPSYDDVDDVVDRYDSIIDVMDGLFEKADVCLDELRGHSRRTESTLQQPALEVTQLSQHSNNGKLEYKFLHAKNIVRPQLKFKDRINNSATAPLERKIVYKPHALVPLDNTESMEMDSGTIVYSMPHPYEYEVKNLVYPDHVFEEREHEIYNPLESSTATWVDTEEGLIAMMNAFEGADEIAVDLEYHNYRSYQGFTCLMQISTRDQDFIIDTLEIRDKMWMLNEYFANPAIIKVCLFHGAESDIIWLQRDFGLYIVNLFDTYFATKVLEFPHHGLAYLLKKYCSVDADKKYQLADWRIRPLPEEMLHYARSDTHYLLYIYDCLRKELMEKSGTNQNLLRAVLQRSAELSLHKHEREVYDAVNGLGPGGWRNLLEKWKYSMNVQQKAVFKQLHHWRDHTAREEDESTRYVLPNHMLFALVERMPIDSAGVIGCCNPCPPIVRMNAQAIAMLIQRTKADALSVHLASENNVSEKETVVIEKPKKVAQLAEKMTKRKRDLKADEAFFDLEKIKMSRIAEASVHTKPSSALFHTLLSESLSPELSTEAYKKVELIKSSLKLAFPFEGLVSKVKSRANQ